MAKAFVEAIKADVFIEIIRKGFEKLMSNAADTGGKALGKKLEQIFEPKPRAIVDKLIDHLDELVNISATDAKKATKNLKARIKEAAAKGKENRLVTALCKLLTLDPVNAQGEYHLGHTNAAERLAELGLMEEENFKQSIEFLIDDVFAEWVQTYIKDKIPHYLKLALKKIKKRATEFEPTLSKGIAALGNSIEKVADMVTDGAGTVVDNIKKFDKNLAKKIDGAPKKRKETVEKIERLKKYR